MPLLVDDALHVGGDLIHAELGLRDQAQVHHARGHGRLHGDEAGLAPHELHDSQAALGAGGLHLGGEQGPLGLLHGGLVPEAAVNQQDVVVDRLGHPDDRHLEPALLHLVVDGARRGVAAVAAHHKHHVDAPQVQAVHHAGDLGGAAARGAQDGAAAQLDAVHHAARQVERLGLVVVQPHEAVADAQDLVLRHAVVRKRKHDILHHVVQPGAQAAAGDDGGGDLLGLKVYPLARPRAHGEGREGDAGAVVRVGHALAARRTRAVDAAVLH
mmetsp:Transcript_28702/g.73679  ORF Transcript_28702/g.73679 Transcript_28702/m.73679 type:complete len:270 (+) Transcript_28702:737-1546(+)